MMYTTVPLNSLLAPQNNPRRRSDRRGIVALAESIRQDGILQNLIVSPAPDDKFRIIAGQRRYLALRLLRSRREIEPNYLVPVEIRDDAQDEHLRLATVENVQRQALNPIDEAEAFAALVEAGANVEEVAAKTGVAAATVRRRLALANLCSEVKREVRDERLAISMAEAFTLGSHEQQRALLRAIESGEDFSASTVRRDLLDIKPKLGYALFPPNQYQGRTTRDLFAEAEEAYCDDVDEFLRLQREAVATLATSYRDQGLWVDIVESTHIEWWKYRAGSDGDDVGVVIAIALDGKVETRENVVRAEPPARRSGRTKAGQGADRQRPEFTARFLRYVAIHKSVAAQGAVLADRRKSKELAATILLSPLASGGQLVLRLHPCLGDDLRNVGFAAVCKRFDLLRQHFATEASDASPTEILEAVRVMEPVEVYRALKTLSDDELDQIILLLLIACFGQPGLAWLDTETSLLNEVAGDLKVDMRDWWTPDEEFFSMLERRQLLDIAKEMGANDTLRAASSKRQLVVGLARLVKAGDQNSDCREAAGADGWLHNAMRFPAIPQGLMQEP